MAVNITPVSISRAGIDMITSNMVAADVTGNKWTGTGSEFAVLTNGSGAPITVTEVITGTVDGQTPAGRTVSIPAGKTYIIGSFPNSAYGTAANVVNLTYSGVTSLTIGVFLFV